MKQQGRVIDAAVRFLRTNPALMAYASAAAPASGATVEQLLAATVERARSAAEAVAEQEMVPGSAG